MLGTSSSIVEHFGALIPHVADFRMGVVLEHSSGFERTKKVLWRSLDFFAIERTLVVFRVKDGRHPVVYRSPDRIGGHRDNCITLKLLTVCRILPSIPHSSEGDELRFDPQRRKKKKKLFSSRCFSPLSLLRAGLCRLAARRIWCAAVSGSSPLQEFDLCDHLRF
jgi:hypothetical protein